VSEVPDVEISVIQGGKPVLNSGILRTHVVIGYASAGTLAAKEVTTGTLVSTFVSGDAVKACARAIDRASAKAIFVRRTHTAVAATKTTLTSVVGTALPTVSGTPAEAYEVIFTITDPGTIAGANAEYTLSLDNGTTETIGTVPATGIVVLGDSGMTLTFNPPANALVAAATEIRADLLAHFANAVAHNSADATAAAIITLPAPTNNTESIAVLNQCRLAVNSHLANFVAHDSQDLVNDIVLGAAVTEQDGVALATELKTKINAHLQATYPAAAASLLALTASSVAPQIYTDGDLIAGGVTQVNDYPSYITFTTDAAGTPSDAPATATIAGTNFDTELADTDVVNISQIAGTATATKRFIVDGDFSITYSAGDGTGAQISIGTSAAAHNSADVTNNVTTANPLSGTLVAEDEVLVSSTDPSPAILSLTVSGSGTLDPTTSGTPYETIRGRIEFLTAGTIGTEDDGLITYRVSLDGGNTWQSTASLGVDESIVLVDKRVDETTTPTGVTINLTATETVDVDTVITFRTTAPHVAIADVLAAISVAAASSYKQRGWRFYHIVGNYTASEMAQVQTLLNSLQASKQWNYAMMQFRDSREHEIELDWITNVVADRETVNLNRVASYAGYALNFTCPLTNRLDRRPAAWLDAARRLCVDINVESGRKKDGPLGSEVLGKVGGEGSSGDVTLYEDGERIEYDADVDSTLPDARISTLRTFTNEGAGVYFTGSMLATGPASKFKRTRDRDLNDEASRALSTEGIRQLLDNIRRNPGDYPADAQPGDPGTILEADALTIESEAKSAVEARIGSKANLLRITVSRTDNLTGTVPRIITETLEIEGQPVIEGVSATQIFNG
jgi:hypothetical protein